MQSRVALVLLTAGLITARLEAQTLAVRPSPFSDLKPGRQARQGEVVLGETTLKSALRMFAVELNSETVSLPRRHSANPDVHPAGTVWKVGTHELRPQHRLDLGPDRYELDFDRNGRLIAAIDSRVPNGIIQPMLAEHYPGVQKGNLWRSDPPLQEWIATVDPCVVLSALVRETTGVVQQLSYNYICETKPAGN
jgi:hypothetical protein